MILAVSTAGKVGLAGIPKSSCFFIGKMPAIPPEAGKPARRTNSAALLFFAALRTDKRGIQNLRFLFAKVSGSWYLILLRLREGPTYAQPNRCAFGGHPSMHHPHHLLSPDGQW
jgi:hypothetical protein